MREYTKKRVLSILLSLTLVIIGVGQWSVPKSVLAADIRDISSMELVQKMNLGWNLGDSLDVCAADRDGDGKIDDVPANGVVDETLWGNVRTTRKIFETLKAQGINAVRIPVTWRDHMGEAPDYTIDGEWMYRVNEVVDYAYSQGMYVIINVHHDGGGDPDFGAWIRNASEDKEAVLARYKAVWKQIAAKFQKYSDRLIFESMNEVGFDDLDKSEAFSLLNEFNQTFVDLVRASGGNNAKRHLLIAGYWTDIEETCSPYFTMPTDPANHCILSLHYYTPWQFCTTNIQPTWGTEEDLEVMKEKISLMKENFIDQGIPVIIGEFGTGLNNETESRIRFCSEFVGRCKEIGIPAFFWDNGGEFNRSTLKWRTEGLLEAMVQAVKKTTATPEPSSKPSTAPTKKLDNTDAKKSTVLKKGQKFTKAGSIYRVTKSGTSTKAEVTYVRPAKKNKKKITVPDTVSYKTVSCKVTSVGANAFKNNIKLKQVTLGENVKSIGKKAFLGCKKLKKLVIYSDKITKVGKKAFRKIAKKPVVTVPANKVKKYKKLLKLPTKTKYKKKIWISNSKLTLKVGGKQKLRLIGNSKKVTWSSKDKKIATVSSKGIVTAKKTGSTKIVAKAAKKKYQCKVTVKVATASKKTEISKEPSVTPTQEPTDSRNAEEVTALQKIVKEQQALGSSEISNDMSSSQYKWANGCLTEIDWEVCDLSGSIDFSAFPELTSLSVPYNDVDEINISANVKLEILNCSSNAITRLQIGEASSLKKLDCSWNELSSLECLGCKSLEYLNCSYNHLTSLDLSKCPNLLQLYYDSNKISDNIYSGLEKLEVLSCDNNDIAILDVRENSNLLSLGCESNKIESLDLTQNLKLQSLYCSINPITELNVDSLTELEWLICYNCKLTSLDLSRNNNLEYISCYGNQLQELDLANLVKCEELCCNNNQLESLDVSQCLSLYSIDCSENQLTSLDLTDCQLEDLDCSNNQIEEIKGISNIWDMNCSENQLTSLDLTDCQIEDLDCSNNQIKEIKGGSSLWDLDCSGNQLTNLDVSNYSSLFRLSCNNNQLTSLDVSNCENLLSLYCNHNQLTSLKIALNSEINVLDCTDNLLTELDVTGCKLLENLYCDAEVNLIGWCAVAKNEEDVANLNALIQKLREAGADLEEDCRNSKYYFWEDGRLCSIDWSSCGLSGKITISGLSKLQSLNCDKNQITDLDVSGCKELMYLSCKENLLTTIDLTANTMLWFCDCDDSVTVKYSYR